MKPGDYLVSDLGFEAIKHESQLNELWTTCVAGKSSPLEGLKGASPMIVKRSPIAQHSSRTDEWGTPSDIIERSRRVLGTIELDPASSAEFNRTVRAERFLTKEDNALTCDWGNPRTIFLNPPGGKLKNRSIAALFWVRLMRQLMSPGFDHAIFLGFSLEQLQTTQTGTFAPSIISGAFPFCVPRKRVSFVHADGSPGPSPTHSNIVVYIPDRVNKLEIFKSEFESLGDVRL